MYLILYHVNHLTFRMLSQTHVHTPHTTPTHPHPLTPTHLHPPTPTHTYPHPHTTPTHPHTTPHNHTHPHPHTIATFCCSDTLTNMHILFSLRPRHTHKTYSRIKCQIYTHSKKNLRKDFILFVCCYLPSTILIEVCTLQIKSLSSKF